MIILATNVISELLRRAPDPAVEAWLSEQSGAHIYLMAISKAALSYGVAIMANGKRQRMLAEAVDAILREDFRDRILSFDSEAADHYAKIAAGRRSDGRPISQFDCQIASIARAHGAAVATRNIDDFERCGIKVIDPWRHTKHS